MPRLSTPSNMPDEVLVAIEVIGNNVRTELLRQLTAQPLTALELAERVGVHSASVHRHLVLLEERGLIFTEVQKGQRRGQTVKWQTQQARVAELGRLWVEYVASTE